MTEEPAEKPVEAAMPELVVAWVKHSDSVPGPSLASSPAAAAALTATTALAVADVLSENCSEACNHPFYCEAFVTTPQLPPATAGMTAEQLAVFERDYLPEMKVSLLNPGNLVADTLHLRLSFPHNLEIARISADGVLTLFVSPSDENARMFLDALSAQFKKPITAVEIQPPQS